MSGSASFFGVGPNPAIIGLDDPANTLTLGAPAIIRGTMYLHQANNVVANALGSAAPPTPVQSSAIQTQNGIAIQAAFTAAVTNGKIIEVLDETYEYIITGTSGLNIPYISGAPSVIYRGCGAGTNFVNFNTSPNNPVFTVGDITGANYLYYPDIQGVGWVHRGVARTSPGTADLTIDCAIGPIAWGRVCDVFTGNKGGTVPANPSTYGMAFVTPSGSTATFSSIFDNFQVNGCTVDVAHIPVLGSGNVFRNWYMNGGGEQHPTPPTITGSIFNMGSGGASNEQTWEQLNLEWTTCGNAANLANNLGAQFLALHVEGPSLTGTFANVVSLSGATVQVNVMTAETITNTTMTSGTTQVFYSYQSYLNLNTLIVNQSASPAPTMGFPLVMFMPQGNAGLDSPSGAIIHNIKCQDGTALLSTYFSLDSHTTLSASAFRLPYAIVDYEYGVSASTITKADIPITATYTHYGMYSNATLEVPAIITSFTMTLSHVMGASGNQTVPFNQIAHVRRQTGTPSGTLTINDASGTTLATNTTVTDYFFQYVPILPASVVTAQPIITGVWQAVTPVN